MQNICKSRDDNVLLIRGFSLFWSKIFGNRMCQAWPKQLENEGIQALQIDRGFSPFFISQTLSSMNKTDHHNITEILLNVALNTITHP